MVKIFVVQIGNAEEDFGISLFTTLSKAKDFLEQEFSSDTDELELSTTLNSISEDSFPLNNSELFKFENDSWFTLECNTRLELPVLEDPTPATSCSISSFDGAESPISVSVSSGAEGVWIGIKGYSDYHGSEEIMLLEKTQHGLEIRIWADNNLEDHTHELILEGAKDL